MTNKQNFLFYSQEKIKTIINTYRTLSSNSQFMRQYNEKQNLREQNLEQTAPQKYKLIVLCLHHHDHFVLEIYCIVKCLTSS